MEEEKREKGKDKTNYDSRLKPILIKGIQEINDWFHNDNADFLESIFSQISIIDLPDNHIPFYVPPVLIADKAAYPSRLNKEDYDIEKKETKKRFVKYLNDIENYSINQLLLLLERFGGIVPVKESNGKVSLYDYYKVKALKEVISYKRTTGESDNSNLLISGDISGIQSFIYNISSDGALKNLRARSFFVELLNEHIIDRILADFDIPRLHILFNGGGGFYIISHNPADAGSIIETIKYDINKWLLEKFNGRLYLAITSIPFADNEMDSGFKDVIERASNNLFIEKQQKFKEIIEKGEFRFIEDADPLRYGCEICFTDKDDDSIQIDDSRDICCFCDKLIKLGRELPKIKAIYQTSSQAGENHYIEIDKIYYVLTDDTDIKTSSACKWIFYRDENSFDEILKSDAMPFYGLPYTRLIRDLTPDIQKSIKEKKEYLKELKDQTREREEKEAIKNELDSLAPDSIASMEWLSESAEGEKLIGALRMDADNMGRITKEGFYDGISIEKISSLSRYILYFFKLYLPMICRGETGDIEPTDFSNRLTSKKGRDVTVVYSGGDDLFLMGSWSDVAELAIDIGKTFKRYTCNNIDVGISGGMTIHHNKFPVNQMAAASAKGLESSKENCDPCWQCRKEWIECPFYKDGECLRKDSITPFYTTYSANRQKEVVSKVRERATEIPPRFKLSVKWQRQNEKGKNNEVEEFIINPLKRFKSGAGKLPKGFFHRCLDLLNVWYKDGAIYLPQMVWLLKNVQETLKREITKEGVSMYDLFDEILHSYDPAKFSILHIPLMWIVLLEKGGDKSEKEV